MVIRKMNSVFLKHGRVLFGAITLVIIVSFVGFLTPGFTSLFSSARQESGTIGVIFGKNVSASELKRQVDNGIIVLSLQYGGDPRNPALLDMARDGAFDALCLRKAAQMRGVCVGPKEIADFIRGLPIFKGEKGGFDMSKYENFAGKVLAPAGFDKYAMDEAVREFLAGNKLLTQVADEVVVTPDEVARFFQSTHEKFKLRAARFKAASFSKDIKLDPKDVEAHFNANKDSFKTPPRFNAAVVSFDYDDYKKKAAELVSADSERLKKAYEEKKETLKDKDGKEQSFDAAKAALVESLASEDAEKAAMRDAQTFAVDAYKTFENIETEKYAAFKDSAKKKGRSPVETGWFAADALKVEPFGREKRLVTAISNIYQKVPISDAIPGKKAAFVAFLLGREESRDATLDEVREKVEAGLRNEKSLALAREKAREAVVAIQKAPDQAKKAEELKSSKAVAFDDVEEFTMLRPPYIPDGRILAKLAEGTRQGAVSPAENTPDGALFVFVDKRVAPAADEFDKQKETVEMIYKQRKQQAAMEAFVTWLRSQSAQRISRQGGEN